MLSSNIYIGTNGVLVGFNVWPVLLILGVVVMIIAGIFQYNTVNGRIHKRYNERMFQVIACALSAIVEFSMIAEMGQGAALEANSFFGAFIAFVLIGMMMIVVYWGIGEIVGRKVKNRLKAYLR